MLENYFQLIITLISLYKHHFERIDSKRNIMIQNHTSQKRNSAKIKCLFSRLEQIQQAYPIKTGSDVELFSRRTVIPWMTLNRVHEKWQPRSKGLSSSLPLSLQGKGRRETLGTSLEKSPGNYGFLLFLTRFRFSSLSIKVNWKFPNTIENNTI